MSIIGIVAAAVSSNFKPIAASCDSYSVMIYGVLDGVEESFACRFYGERATGERKARAMDAGVHAVFDLVLLCA